MAGAGNMFGCEYRDNFLFGKETIHMNNVPQTEEAQCLSDCLCGWCRVGSIVRSEFYINEADQERTVSKVVPYTASRENGLVWTNDANLKALEGVDLKDWIRPLAAGKLTAAIFSP